MFRFAKIEDLKENLTTEIVILVWEVRVFLLEKMIFLRVLYHLVEDTFFEKITKKTNIVNAILVEEEVDGLSENFFKDFRKRISL